MKKIVYIGNKLSKKGKTITSIETLGNNLSDLGYEVVTASNKSNKLLRLLDMIYIVLANIKSVDFVLIDTYSTSNFYYAYIISKICNVFGVKYIPILRGGNLPSRLKTSKKKSEAIFANAYRNIAPSKYLQSIFNNHGYLNVDCIPNTIHIEDYQYDEKQFDTIKLLWLRSFSEIYNPQMAIKLASEIKNLGLDYKLCMVGPDIDGSMQKVKDLAKTLNIEVNFTGKLTKEQWRKLSKGYNIFINTTNFDNTPISVIEAMALGLPIISTNVGGIPYLIEDNKDGYLINADDVKAMVNKVLDIQNNRDKSIRIAKNARAKVEKFDWKIVKQDWVKLLE